MSSASPGFTLLELAVVIFIMGLMLTLALPYLGGFREAALKSQARRLAGRATYMFDEATGHKLVLRLIFDIDNNGYAVGAARSVCGQAGVRARHHACRDTR